MAWQIANVYIYDNTWSLITKLDFMSSNATIWGLLSVSSVISAWITELSATIWWEMLSHDSIVQDVLSIDEEHTTGENSYKAYKYEEPIETITGFYLDGTEYKFYLNQVDDTTLSSSWDWDTTHAPSKNAVYDAIWNIETLLAAL